MLKKNRSLNTKEIDSKDSYISTLLRELEKNYDFITIVQQEKTEINNNLKEDIIRNIHTLNYKIIVYKIKKGNTFRKILKTNNLKRVKKDLSKTEFVKVPGKIKIPKIKKTIHDDIIKGLVNKYENLNNEIKRIKSSYISEMETSYNESKISIISNQGSYYDYSNDTYITYEFNHKKLSVSDYIPLKVLNIEKVISRIRQELERIKKVKQLTKLNNEKIKKIRKIVITPRVISELIDEIVVENLLENSIIDQSSYFLKNGILFEKRMNLYDITHKMFSSNPLIDFEFTKTKDYSLIEKGEVKNFITSKFYYEKLKEIISKHSKNEFEKAIVPKGNYFGITSEKHLVFGKKKDLNITKKDVLKFDIEDYKNDETLIVDSVLGMHTLKPSEFKISLVIDRGMLGDKMIMGNILVGNLEEVFKNFEYTESNADAVSKIRGLKVDANKEIKVV